MRSAVDWWEERGDYLSRLMSAMATDPDRAVLQWRGRVVTAGEVVRSVAGLATALHGLGVGPGGVVSVLVAPNSPAMLMARYAANLLGAAVCCIRSTNPASTAVTLTTEAQLDILESTSAGVLFTDLENEARAQALCERARRPIALVGFDVQAAGTTRVRPGDGPPPGDFAHGDPEALAVIGFTSGSTGRPKGIQLPARVWENSVSGVLLMLPEQVRMLCATPLEQTAGPMVDAALISGGTVYLQEEFDPAAVLRSIEADRITEAFLATTFLYRLLDHCRTETADLSSLRGVIYGGSAAAPARLEEALRVLGPVLAQGYGTSECGSISVLGPDEHKDSDLLSTVGRPLPGVSVRICDPGSDRELAVGEKGEVVVKSHRTMHSYLADPVQTSRVLHGGWYRTGDIAYLDERGYLHLLDRVDDIVKTAGVKVYPAVVERETLCLPGVLDAAVFGVRDESNTEHLHAAVVQKPGGQVSAESIRSHLRVRLSDAHVPEDILMLSELPLNVAGKPDRSRLRHMWRTRKADR